MRHPETGSVDEHDVARNPPEDEFESSDSPSVVCSNISLSVEQNETVMTSIRKRRAL